ncbi:MAG: thioredoxin TrxC [Marinobacter sp.]|uniref:thioredoxin TrxC n=1 Tax=Marinobacter sp. TaxID=50741 RepID=UPI0029C2C117|nr:thioredoxin TrxC [Marinobacter sp.]MDX5329019.1 thioredoxin TrxC [Marinobacter sp.]MDX5385211.1 thioredoxin TrxC [Marinobacter sp.]MDX5441955.1 thioredoxin TrxC [Alteromonadaceae bacterium]MDX5470914.1 thioredoxin TrxC [Marinobacter sp.]
MTDIRHLVCPHCHKTNRVPAEKLSAGGNCGACKQALWPDQLLDLTEQTFAAHTGRSDVPVVVDFWASWCGPCKVMAPQFEQAAKAWRGKVRFAKLNTEQSPGPAGQFGIRSIPTMILFQNGREVARQSGAMNQAQISQWLQSKGIR